MKSYEERLPLIDAAIDVLKGVFPPTAIGYSGRGYYAKGDFANILHGVCIGDICTRDEFEQRKSELAAKEQNMNDWYEKGGLPPVGEVVEAMTENKTWIECQVLHHRVNNSGMSVAACMNTRTHGLFWSADFKPLRTETDKLVEQMMFHGCQSLNRKEATELVEKGYRKIKQQSEQEFMKQCVDICGHGDARLYRAGCRFIEQGDV